MGVARSLIYVRVHAGVGSPGLESTPECEGAHRGNHGLERLEDFLGRRAFIERDPDVGSNLLDISPECGLDHDLQEFLSLAIEQTLIRIRGLEEGRVLLQPLEISRGHHPVHLKRVASLPVHLLEEGSSVVRRQGDPSFSASSGLKASHGTTKYARCVLAFWGECGFLTRKPRASSISALYGLQ